MTLWDRKLGLILGLALFTFACEEPGEIGLDINPENGRFVARYFEIPVENSVIQHEDILSDNFTRVIPDTQLPSGDGRLIVGSLNTPEFGSLKSKAFSSFYLTKTGFHPDEYFYDSLVLHMRFDYLYGDNFLGEKKIYVHELTDEIKVDSLYLTKNTTPYSADPIGQFRFDPSSFDTTKIDTVYSARLSDELGKRFFDRAISDTLTYSNNEEFRKFFNGLAFVSDELNDLVAGIHAESQKTFMRLHIHKTPDTLSYFDFKIEGFTQDTIYNEDDTLFSRVNLTRYYNNITLNKSGSPIAGIPGYYEDFETENSSSYIAGSAGVFTKLNLGKYFNFLDTTSNLVINRAELVIPVENYEDFLTPSPSLSLYVTDDTNRFVESNQDSITSIYRTVGGVTYSEIKNENRGEYRGDITPFIQSLTSGESVDTLLLLGQPALYNSVLTVNQTVIEKDKIFLKVYYSSIK